jgi:two-component system sensor histidine kinase/response regulator
VAFEDVFLIYAIVQRCAEIMGVAEGRASLEDHQELIEAREEALAASRAKSDFLSSMSHEIRTPLNAILGMTELLGDSGLDTAQQRYLDVMSANGSALLDLINSILDLAKIEAGRLQIENVDFDLVELIDQTVSTLGPRAHAKGIELMARIAPEVPECLLGDPLRLRQILINLLGNAIKFTDVGEVRLIVEAEAQPGQAATLRFSVADSGVGIAQVQLETIFDSFTQADSSTTRQYGGSGLGLAIVRRLAGLMDGRIDVESVVGSGSTFTFTATFGIATTVIIRKDNELPDLTGIRVLIVDDSPINRLIAREMLQGRGALAAEAESGPDALTVMREADRRGHPFGIILLGHADARDGRTRSCDADPPRASVARASSD